MLMQTTSPSYLLMSSLDAARHQAVQPCTWTEPIQAATRIRENICSLPGITLLEKPPGVCSSIHASFWQAVDSSPQCSICCGALLLHTCFACSMSLEMFRAEKLLCLQEL